MQVEKGFYLKFEWPVVNLGLDVGAQPGPDVLRVGPDELDVVLRRLERNFPGTFSGSGLRFGLEERLHLLQPQVVGKPDQKMNKKL